MFTERDAGALLSVARDHVSSGASYLDLNASMLLDREEEALFWGADLLLDRLDTGLSFDSPDPAILCKAAHRYGDRALLNSFTSDDEVISRALPALLDSGASCIVMLKSREGIPDTSAGRLLLAESVSSRMSREGIPPERVYLDPVFEPIATTRNGLTVALETLLGLEKHLSGFNRIGGLSNISFGLPNRKLLNRTFLAMAVSHGITALICDPTDAKLMEILRASEASIGLDPGCRKFLRSYRENKKKGHHPGSAS